ncbi:MAG: hypothetical protein WBM07_18385 [Chitinivibrionales bacterium]
MIRRFIISRPLSAMTFVLAAILIVFEASQIFRGVFHFKPLDRIDSTTLLMIGALMAWGVTALRDRADFQAVAFVVVNSLSCVFAYEMLFKWSFFLAPFRCPMPPAELRDFTIQTGIALTVLTGFADGHFSWKKTTTLLAGVFIVGWAIWLLVGFPQLNRRVMFSPVINVHLSHVMVYLINRGTKFLLFLVYLTFFPPLHRARAEI